MSLTIFVWVFFKTGFFCVALSVLDSFCRPGWPQTQEIPPAFPGAGVKGICHHAQPSYGVFVYVLFLIVCEEGGGELRQPKG